MLSRALFVARRIPACFAVGIRSIRLLPGRSYLAINGGGYYRVCYREVHAPNMILSQWASSPESDHFFVGVVVSRARACSFVKVKPPSYEYYSYSAIMLTEWLSVFNTITEFFS